MFKSKFIACLAVLCSVGMLAGCNPSTDSTSGDKTSTAEKPSFDFDKTQAIKVASRDETSGTRECFTEKALVPNAKKDANMVNHETIASSDAMISAIAGDKYGIGYSSYDSVKSNNTVKMLKFGAEGNLVEPTEANIENKSYTLQRYFNIVANVAETGDKGNLVKAFYDFTLSNDGFDIAKANGGIVTSELNGNAINFDVTKYGDVFSKNNSSITLAVGGSTSVTEISNAQIAAFKALFTGDAKAPTISTDRQGSGSAVSGIAAGTYDIGCLSREINSDEQKTITDKGYKNAHFAIDAVVAIVNPANPLTGISNVDLGRIYGKADYLATLKDFQGKATNITTWSQLIK